MFSTFQWSKRSFINNSQLCSSRRAILQRVLCNSCLDRCVYVGQRIFPNTHRCFFGNGYGSHFVSLAPVVVQIFFNKMLGSALCLFSEIFHLLLTCHILLKHGLSHVKQSCYVIDLSHTSTPKDQPSSL